MIRNLMSGDAFGLLSLRMFFEEDSGDGGSGGDGGAGDARFTQADVDRMIVDRVKAKDRALKEHEKNLEKLKTELADVKAKLETPTPSGGTVPDPTKQGEIEILERKYQRQLDELNAKLTNVDKDREAEKARRMKTEKDKELGDALTAVQCQDTVMGRRYFDPQIEWDTVEEKWMYRTKSGNLVNILDGVTDELPNSLKPPSMQGGGSGSGGTPPKRLAKKAELEAAKVKLTAMEKAARESRANAGLVAQWNTQKKIVQKLEAEYAS
jgi:hypothetical protein